MRPLLKSRIPLSPIILLAAATLVPKSAGAGDITAFVAVATPRESWARGYGAALSSTWFKVLTFEGEAARLPGNTTDAGMTSFTASAVLHPPFKALVPYGGVGYGLYRSTQGTESEIGRLRALILGVKARIKDLVVLKAEYRRFDLSKTPPLRPLEQRLSVGAGIAF